MYANLVKLYHQFPPPMRTVAASARGYYLRHWRYGPETEALVEAALARDGWSQSQWKTWREERLAYILWRAATHVPYYHRHWSQRRQRGDRASWEVLDNWPILTKDTLRENTQAFLADDSDPRKMYASTTSGSTGTPLTSYLTRDTLRLWYAIFEARIRRWYGVSIKERWALLGGELVVRFDQKKPPYWVRNWGLNQLYVSTYHLTARNAGVYVEALRRYAPTHMIVYPSSAHFLATEILEQGLEPLHPRVIFSNAEALLSQQREAISKAFGCPVRNTYGMSELIAGAGECEHGSLHLWPEVGLIEGFELQADSPVSSGQAGRFIITGLLNPDMPLIRYAIGDHGQLAAEDAVCACGRSLPMITSVDGRMNDLIITVDGRRIFYPNAAFFELAVREAQIVQESLAEIQVNLVPDTHYTARDGETLTRRLRERVGDMRITLHLMDQIPRAKNGKLRAVISRISAANLTEPMLEHQEQTNSR